MAFFFFNDTATTEIYTLSLHDALPIFPVLRALIRLEQESALGLCGMQLLQLGAQLLCLHRFGDRKSTRLNSSHANISYAVFCLKKKKINLSTSTCTLIYEITPFTKCSS